MHRVFIAINLPGKIKKELAKIQSQWPRLPIRWTKSENLHITLIFLGNLSDEEVGQTCIITNEINNMTMIITTTILTYRIV